MKAIKSILLGGALLTSVNVFSQAEMFLLAEDEASITVRKTLLEDGSYEFEGVADTPDLLDINYIYCSETACRFELVLKEDGPVDFTGFNVHKWTPYGYATITLPDIAIDIDHLYSNTEIQLSEAYTYPTTDPDNHAEFVPVSSGNASASVRAVNGSYITIYGFFSLLDMLPGETTQYQTFQIVGSGIPWSPLYLARDFDVIGTTNKGEVAIENLYGAFEWTVTGWNTGTGHFASMNVLTNGDDVADDGIDLSQYNTMEVVLACEDQMVIEAFIGYSSYDSTQHYLQDIQCDGSYQTYIWDISSADRSDIQTALWLHVPVWKNAHLAQAETLSMTIAEVMFTQ